MAKSSIECPNCGKMVYVVINHAFCKECNPVGAKTLKEINKEYAGLNKKKGVVKHE